MVKRFFVIIFLLIILTSFISISEGFDNNANFKNPEKRAEGQREYTHENAIKSVDQGGYYGGHDTIAAEGMLLKEQVHQQTDPDGGIDFRNKMVREALPSLRIGAHDEDTNKWLNWNLKDPPIGSTGWGGFFDHFYNYKNKN